MAATSLLCLSFILGRMALSFAQDDVTVTSPAGRILGSMEYISVDGKTHLISKFLGVPYAESMTGRNRFQKPIPKRPFKGLFDARKIPNACYQSTQAEMKVTEEVYGQPGFSEDCLTLNIYVPGNLSTKDRKPVMIWIHGGGFTNGAGSIFDGSALSVFGDVIVVTINYRLGMFGFLRDSDGTLIGNQGLWDQHLAIKWVHDNINSFGGLNDEVTLFGESAGGASVLLQALYDGNRGLIKRIIAESGSSVSYWSVADETVSEKFIADQGCMAKDNVVTCLQDKQPSSLITNTTYSFAPVVDGDFLVAAPREIIFGNSSNTSSARDFYSSLDIIVGVNNNEGIVYLLIWQSIYGKDNLDFEITRQMFKDDFVPWIVNNTIETKDEASKTVLGDVIDFEYTRWEESMDPRNVKRSMIDMWNDALFFVGAQQAVQGHYMLNGTGNAYLYEFAYEVDTDKHQTPVPSWFTGNATTF